MLSPFTHIRLAHFTPAETPTGLLLFLAGFACGALAMLLVRRFRTS